MESDTGIVAEAATFGYWSVYRSIDDHDSRTHFSYGFIAQNWVARVRDVGKPPANSQSKPGSRQQRPSSGQIIFILLKFC